ncbi:MAG: peptide chain release factor N(5)-glutamine methyltransferase [Nitrospira sp.]|nr:peptide chain release factor N(5)-glutamine methyltransferase [Nitrospira sp.]MCP9474408.1 peptide chain release factor N(5)-glutamine methyltransferase [Nitrospira sp.]
MRESRTIEALLGATKRTLAQAGVEQADQESRWIVSHVLGLEGHQLVSRAEQSVSDETWSRVASLASRRSAREPLQYILGTQEFCGLEFHVTPAVLIPRPETELLVQEALRVVDFAKETVLVDVGTGSGCVAVTLATILDKARIVAVDRSPEALAVAKANAERHGVVDKIEWMEGDLLSPLRERGLMGKVDVIASNPPYIAEAEWANLQPEVRGFEPRSSLVSGPSGTEFHERLLRESLDYLVPGGTLVMEIGSGQFPAVRRMAEQIKDYGPAQVVKDEAGLERTVVVQRME